MLFEEWSYTATRDTRTIIMPDGCRDILVIEEAPDRVQVRLTDWDYGPRCVSMKAGQTITGFRLRPGVSVGSEVIGELGESDIEVRSFIGQEVRADAQLIEIVEALSDPQVSISDVARQVGVCVRTLQRRFRKLSIPAPDYWRLLARVRRSVALLSQTESLAEIAGEAGYSDQSHMTREFGRWFGMTPAQMRFDAKTQAEIGQPGLGNWTGEHISIR